MQVSKIMGQLSCRNTCFLRRIFCNTLHWVGTYFVTIDYVASRAQGGQEIIRRSNVTQGPGTSHATCLTLLVGGYRVNVGQSPGSVACHLRDTNL